MKKAQYVLFILMLASIVSFAQDKIYLHNTDVISAKIKSLTPEQITYKRWDNQDGPEYTVFTADVIKIVYANGSQDIMDMRLARRMKENPGFLKKDSAMVRCKNYAYLSPLQFSENGFGLSLSYERNLDKSGIFRFYLPVITTFNVANNVYTDLKGNTVVREDPMFYVMPGFKVRVFEQYNNSVFLGTSMVFAEGNKTQTIDSTSNGGYQTTKYAVGTQNKFLFGMIGHASAEVYLKPKIYFMAEIGLGWTYIYSLNNVPQNNSGLFELGFKIGYRY